MNFSLLPVACNEKERPAAHLLPEAQQQHPHPHPHPHLQQQQREAIETKRNKGLQGPNLKNKGSNCSYSYSYNYRLRSFTFYSLNWMYDAFYPNKTRKVIPDFINIYLTPLALAV